MSQSGKFINGTGSGGIETITGNSGGAVGPDGAFNVNLLGSGGVTVSGNPGTNTLTIAVSGSGFVWNEITAASASMATDNGYITNRATLVTLTLPATAAQGTGVAIIGKGAGGWTIAQNAGQNIQIGSTSSTVGAGGSVSSTNRFDSIEIICTTANTTWTILGAPQGTLTII